MTAAAQQIQMLVQKDGTTRLIYCELLDLASLGRMDIRRASNVEPDQQGSWWADLSPVSGPLLGPFQHRSDALAAETAWLERHVIAAG